MRILARQDRSPRWAAPAGVVELSQTDSGGGEGIEVRGRDLSAEAAQVTEAEIEAAVNALVQARVQLAAAAAAESAAEGLAFLEENGKREGVVTLESGLQYEVLTAGEGAKPSAADSVTTHYEGRLIDETVFDSSYQRGEPATFPLNGVIKGWTEALQLMPVGSKWRLYLPPQIAYGERGAPPSIPPNATLVFDVELLEIVGQTD